MGSGILYFLVPKFDDDQEIRLGEEYSDVFRWWASYRKQQRNRVSERTTLSEISLEN